MRRYLDTIDPNSIDRIAIRCPNWIGDAVMATSCLQEIKTLFPKSHIVGYSHPTIHSLLKNAPFFDDFFSISRALNEKSRGEKEAIEKLRQLKPDLGILLTNSFSSAWTMFRANIPIRLGLKGHYRRLLLTHSIDTPYRSTKEHDVETYRQLLNGISGRNCHASSAPPIELFVTKEEIEAMKKRLEDEYSVFSSHHEIIVINPGAAYGSAKCWPPDRFRGLIIKLLEEPKYRIFITGDGSMETMIDDIITRMPPRVYNMAKKTSIRELMALIFLADGVVSNDSGPMHIASALKRPLVALFGSTNPYRTGPFNGGKVLYHPPLCSPCYLRVCPIDFRCMTAISVNEVHTSLIEVMKNSISRF